MATYTIPLLILSTTNSSSLTGVTFVFAWAPRLCVFGLAGWTVDRFGATRIFRLAAAARAVVVGLAAPIMAFAEGTAASVITLLAACTGLLTQFSFIAAESIGALASRDSSAGHRVQSVLLGIDQGAALAGPVAGGLVLQWRGASGLLIVIGVLSILSAAIAPRVHPQALETSALSTLGLRSGWATLRRLPALIRLVMGLAMSNLALGLLEAATPVTVTQQFDHSSAAVGLLWSIAAAASLLAVAACRVLIDRWGLLTTGRLAAVVTVLPCFLLAHAGSYRSYLLLIAVFMAGDSVLTVVLRTLRSSLIPPELFGSTLSLTVLILLMPYPLAGAVMAVVAPSALDTVITVCAALQCFGLALAFIRVQPWRGKHRKLTQ
ncbi:MFS transporter [Streptomyces spiralis]